MINANSRGTMLRAVQHQLRQFGALFDGLDITVLSDDASKELLKFEMEIPLTDIFFVGALARWIVAEDNCCLRGLYVLLSKSLSTFGNNI